MASTFLAALQKPTRSIFPVSSCWATRQAATSLSGLRDATTCRPGVSSIVRQRIALLGAIALAGAVDLGLTIELSGTGEFAHDRDEVFALMGGTPQQVPDRYAVGDPGALLPLEGKQVLLQGTRDDQIPPTLPTRFVEKARRAGSEARAQMLSRADHFDVVDPESRAWPAVLAEVKALLDM